MNRFYLLYIFVISVFLTSSLIAEIPCPDGLDTPTVSSKLVPYKASYELQRGGKKAGQAHRELQPIEKDIWQLTMKAKASLMMLKFKYSQKTQFTLLGEKPRPDSYQQIDSATLKSDKKLNQEFDWKQMIENGRYNEKEWQLSLPENVQNRLTSLVNLRLDLLNKDKNSYQQNSFVYPVSYKGKIRDDAYTILTKENITTPAGNFETLKVEKNHQNKSRSTYFWLAKKLDYIPVRIQQFKDGKEQADMLLAIFTKM